MSTEVTILPERLAQLDTITLDSGNHRNACPENGMCFVEFADWLTGGYGSDRADHISPALRRYGIRLNDRWSPEKRQALRPFGPRLVGTANDGKDARREEIATEWLTGRLLGPWLEFAGMGDHLASIEGKTGLELRDALWAIRKAAWAKRDASRAELRAKIKAHLIERGEPVAVADAVADVVAVADADADVVAVADADAVADAAADADADADAAAVAAAVAAADADAVAVADVVAAAVADAAAAAVAVAAAAAVAVADDAWGTSYSAAHKAATAYYREHPLPVMGAITDLAAKQQSLALELLDALIVAAPAEVSA